MQGFDAVGRHTSTPQFQTPRSWNPRATFSLSRGAHFLKFGGEFLHVQTRINDLNATIGRMNFENRFTNRAVGDLLLGLPSQLALTSYTVMDQGQDMQFYFVQDDYRISPKLTANVGLRYEYATPPRERDNQFANFDPATGTMIFATDGDTFERALIHPDRNNFAPRIGFAYTPGVTLGRARWLRRVLHAHGPAGARGTARFQPALPGRQPAADRRHRGGGRGLGGAVPAGRRLSIGSARSDDAVADHQPPGAGRQSADALHPAIQHRRPVRADARRRARRRLCRQQGHEIERLPQPQSARGHHQRRRLTERWREAVPGVRRHPVDGEPGRLQLQLAAAPAGETVHPRPDRERQLHARRGAERRARSHLDERRRRRHRHRRVPRAAGRQQPARRVRALRVRRAASVRGQLHLGTAVRPRPALGQRLGTARWISRSADGR